MSKTSENNHDFLQNRLGQYSQRIEIQETLPDDCLRILTGGASSLDDQRVNEIARSMCFENFWDAIVSLILVKFLWKPCADYPLTLGRPKSQIVGTKEWDVVL